MGGHLPLLPHTQGVSWSGGSSDQCLLLHGGDDMDVQGSRLTPFPIRKVDVCWLIERDVASRGAPSRRTRTHIARVISYC